MTNHVLLPKIRANRLMIIVIHYSPPGVIENTQRIVVVVTRLKIMMSIIYLIGKKEVG